MDKSIFNFHICNADITHLSFFFKIRHDFGLILVFFCPKQKRNSLKGTSDYMTTLAQWLAYLLPDPALSVPEILSEFLLKLINGAGKRNVNSGLKMLIEPF